MFTIAVCGAGTMGSGIAQVSALAGFNTFLFDVDTAAIVRANQQISKSLQSLADKNKISSAEQSAIFQRINFISSIQQCKADIIIEAIVEKLDVKLSLFQQLSEVNTTESIFATNTSSLSVTAIQSGVENPSRVVGMHFFNPAPVMKLVEVIKGEYTSNEVIQRVYDLCKQLGKVPVLCKDSPGFIVNRVARHYYLEAMKLVEEGVASYENVDEVMEATGFKMGPFKLMDLIGMDINLAVSQGVYESFNNEERFKPSQLQIEKVRAGKLGKKTGEGFYKY
jgi:3-hydroxybutyryl-CoA dehydrogenase